MKDQLLLHRVFYHCCNHLAFCRASSLNEYVMLCYVILCYVMLQKCSKREKSRQILVNTKIHCSRSLNLVNSWFSYRPNNEHHPATLCRFCDSSNIHFDASRWHQFAPPSLRPSPPPFPPPRRMSSQTAQTRLCGDNVHYSIGCRRGWCARWGDYCIPDATVKFAECCEGLRCVCGSLIWKPDQCKCKTPSMFGWSGFTPASGRINDAV